VTTLHYEVNKSVNEASTFIYHEILPRDFKLENDKKEKTEISLP